MSNSKRAMLLLRFVGALLCQHVLVSAQNTSNFDQAVDLECPSDFLLKGLAWFIRDGHDPNWKPTNPVEEEPTTRHNHFLGHNYSIVCIVCEPGTNNTKSNWIVQVCAHRSRDDLTQVSIL
jgi:hypothetical protein